jgi:hypothetical protein
MYVAQEVIIRRGAYVEFKERKQRDLSVYHFANSKAEQKAVLCHFLPCPRNEDLRNTASYKQGNLQVNRNYKSKRERERRNSIVT